MSQEPQAVLSDVHEPNALLMAVFPDPTSDAAPVLFSKALSSDARIEMADVNGRTVRILNGGSCAIRIERGAQRCGLYLVRSTETRHRPRMVRLVVD